MRYFFLCFFVLLSTASQALTLKANAPARYVIQHGDSLWSIANRYLEHPWEWKALWRANPAIKNPNRLYAGDVLALAYVQKTPYIKVLSNGTIKLSPRARPESIGEVVPPVPLGLIRPFLNSSLVLDEDVLSRAPYVVAYIGEHMLGGQGDEVYVKGLHSSTDMPKGGSIAYSLFRPGINYVDPITKKFLGFKATLVGFAELIAGGDPATIVLTSIIQGIKIEDRVLINNSPDFELAFEPSAPTALIKGFIIDMPGSMPNGNTQEAVGGVVVISMGAENGLRPGDVLGLYGQLRVVKDPHNAFIPIKLPPERIGEAMVFRTFTKTSFALVVRSTRAIHLLDIVTNP